MTWQTDPEEGSVWAIQGAKSGARMARLQLQSATRGGQGIVEPADLEVRATEIPGGSVTAASGGCVVLGREQAFQGSYYGYNVGLDTVSIAPTGSEGGRSDLIVARVEDPTVQGPNVWGHAVTDQLIYTRVIQGVSSTATDIPAGSTYSAIPLARVDIPANTATITQGMITDLRTMLQPRSEYVIRTQQGISPIDYAGNIKTPSWENWPDLTWTVRVPTWATQVQVDASWVNMGFFPDDYAGAGSRDARGETRISLISGSTEIVTATGAFNFNEVSSTNGYRVNMGILDDILIPTALRGATCGLRMQVSGDDVGGRLRADTYMHAGVRLNFNELPVSGAS